MLTVIADGVDAALTFGGLVETLREAFRAGAVQPVRHHHTIERPDGAASTLLLMPAWTDFNAAGAPADGHIGVKVVTVSPDNNALGKPAVMGLYLLLDGRTGEPQALIDGPRLTQWRTACASALAASYLARAGRLAAAGDRRRRALPVPGQGAFGGAADPAKSGSGTARSANAESGGRSAAQGRPRRAGGSRSRCRARRGRHRLVRDDLHQPAGQGRAAEAGRPCRPGRRLHAAHAREPTTTPSGAPASMSTPAPAPPRKPATSCSRSPRACCKPDGIVADLHELARGEKQRPRERRRDHAVQIGRRRARGSRGRHRRLPQIGRPDVGRPAVRRGSRQ